MVDPSTAAALKASDGNMATLRSWAPMMVSANDDISRLQLVGPTDVDFRIKPDVMPRA